jgi:hypothetical protein
MTYTPENPPQPLRAHRCATCKCDLASIRRDGCCSKFDATRAKCDREGWGRLRLTVKGRR